MKKPFAPLGCAIEAHVKPDDRRTWDTRSDAGFSLGTSMEHHQCFRVYVTKTRATRISDTVHFKHQYITNPTVSPESHVVAAAQQLATALQGNIPAGNETAEALKKVSHLFTKIATAKSEVTKAKAQHNRVRAALAAQQTAHFPRVESPLPRVTDPLEADCKWPKGRLSRSGGCSDPIRATASCAGHRDAFPHTHTVTLSHRTPQLHLTG